MVYNDFSELLLARLLHPARHPRPKVITPAAMSGRLFSGAFQNTPSGPLPINPHAAIVSAVR